MVIRTTKFTPEVLLSAPRRGAAIPNHDGTIALYTVFTYSFETKEETKELRILEINTGNSSLFSNDSKAHDAKWLGDGTNAIIFLKSEDKGATSLMIGDGSAPNEAPYQADIIPAPMANLKTAFLKDGSLAIAMSGLSDEDGSLYNAETAEKPASTARLYNKTLVRFWDSYMIPQKQVIWYSKLEKSGDGKYTLASPLHNALKGTDFQCPFPDSSGMVHDQFDLGPTGIAYCTIDPNINPGLQWNSDAYFLPIKTFTESEVESYKFTSPFTGMYAGVKLSPDGGRVALIQAVHTQTVDFRLMMAYVNPYTNRAFEFFKGDSGKSAWSLTPSSVEWSRDGKNLYIGADDCGRGSLFFATGVPMGNMSLPRKMSQEGTVTGFHSLDDKSHKVLVSSNSLVENSAFQIIDAYDPSHAILVNSSSKNGLKFGLSHKQVSEFYFEGAGDYCVQAWVVKPSFFDETKKYPLALLIHGGPQSYWGESWSTRWNPAVWAEQGYVVVAPNISGSTGFGLEFAQGVEGQWGGRPYYDLENCFEYIAKNMPYVDTDRAIAAGGSYGGYMALWVQGMPLGRKMKAIVCHDGIFNLHNMIASDVVDDDAQFDGSLWPWENWDNVEKYSPSNPSNCKNWDTPMLIIHSEKDYRCILSDGIAAFHVCQRLGVPSQFLNYPDENHWVLKHENSLVWHRTVFNFINKYSGITPSSSCSTNDTTTSIPPFSTPLITTTSSSSSTSLIETILPTTSTLSLTPNPPPIQETIRISETSLVSSNYWSKEKDLKLFVLRAKGWSWESIAEFHFPETEGGICKERYERIIAGESF